MVEAKVGDIKYYHETGDIYKVQVLHVQDLFMGGTMGDAYRLKILEVAQTTLLNPPKSGLEFSVWKARDAGGYGGWHLLDR